MSLPFPDDESDALELTSDDQDVTRFAADGDLGNDHEFELSHDDGASVDAEVIGVLGEYLLLEPIGRGGMGQVFRAEHRTMNREVAVKILGKQIAGRRDTLERFFAEIRAVAKLMHPNIVTAFDAGSLGDTHYLVMELVTGDVLSSRVRRQGPLTTSEAVSVLLQSARALAYAHKQGIIHRDIKPSNMMFTEDGVLKILDFGLAQLGKERASTNSAKMLMGTPEYMSPEQIENPEQVDARSDLYSLGATLFYLLTGKAMFSGEPMQVARAQLYQKPVPLFTVRGDVDLRLDSVFSKLVAKDPQDRYASATELLDSLDSMHLLSGTVTGSALRRGSYRLASDSPTSVAFDKSTLAKKSQIIAIDLGMTASTAAYFDPEIGPRVIAVGGGTPHMRNMLWSRDGQIKVGPEAVALRHTEPENIFHSAQRWLGAEHIAKPFGGRKAPPEVLVAAVLKQLLRYAASVSDSSSSAIVTVPSCYDQMHRRAIRNACRIAGIDLMQLIDKPLAAALSWLDVNYRLSGSAHHTSEPFSARLLVVHLGGTGLEASVVQVRDTVAQQVGVCGHWKLGAQRWQAKLAEQFAAELLRKTGKSIRDDVAAATRLQRTVELAVDRLASAHQVDVRFDWLDCKLQQTLTQEDFLAICPELSSALQQTIVKACAAAKTDLADVDQVLLAGSILHMKPVQALVKSLLPRRLPVSKIERSEFARGAAIQARHLGSLSTKDRVTPRALGCTAYDIALLAESKQGGKTTPRVLLEKAEGLPASSSHTVRARPVGRQETQPTLQLIESSSLGDSSWLKLGAVKPSELFPLRPADDPLQLRLEMDENGILESSLIWPAGNRQARIPSSSDPEMSDESLRAWRQWLETVMLCSE